MRRFKKIGIVLAILYVIILTTSYIFQERLVFFPSKMPMQHEYDFCQPFEELFLTTPDGAKLNAVHIQNNSTKGVALYFHGNSGNVSHLSHVANMLTRHGYDAILVDYRTFGKSTGAMSEEALYDDAQLFYDYALKTYEENEIVLYGRSFGSGLATQLAAVNNPCRLVLESPFSSAVDLGKHRFPFLPISLMSEFRFPSTEFMQDVKCPVYIFHGTDDSVIPYEFAQKLFESIPGNGKQFYTIKGGGHNYLQDYDVFKNGMKQALN